MTTTESRSESAFYDRRALRRTNQAARAVEQKANRPIQHVERTVVGQFMQWLEDHVKATNAPTTYGYEQTTRMYIIPKWKTPLQRSAGDDAQRVQSGIKGWPLATTQEHQRNTQNSTIDGQAMGLCRTQRGEGRDTAEAEEVRSEGKLTAEQADRLLKVIKVIAMRPSSSLL